MDAQFEGETTASWSKETSTGNRVTFNREFFDEYGIHVQERKTLNPSAYSTTDFARIETDRQKVRRIFSGFPDGAHDLKSARGVKVEIPLVYNNDISTELIAHYGDGYSFFRQVIHLQNSDVGNFLPQVETTYQPHTGELRQILLRVGNPSNYYDEFYQYEMDELDKAYNTPRIEFLHRLHDFYGNDYEIHKFWTRPEQEEVLNKELEDEHAQVIKEKLHGQIAEVFNDSEEEKINAMVENLMFNAATRLMNEKLRNTASDMNLDEMIDSLIYQLYWDHEENLGKPTQYDIDLTKNIEMNSWHMKIVEPARYDDPDGEPEIRLKDDIVLDVEKQFEDIVFTLLHEEGRYKIKIGRFKMGPQDESIVIELQEKLNLEEIMEVIKYDFPSMCEGLQLLDTKINNEPLVTVD